MKTPRFLSKARLVIANAIYSTFKHSEYETWKSAIEKVESFEYQYSFGTHVCYASSLLNMTVILNPTSGLTALCTSNKMVGPSSRVYSKHLGSLLKEKRIPEFVFPVIPPSTMLFTMESEEEVGSREISKKYLDQASREFASEFYRKNFGYVPENIEPDILYFYSSGYREGRKEILEKYLRLPFLRIKSNDKP